MSPTTVTVMTETEAAFQRMLDDDPSNGFTRQLLADYLEDIDDPRAAGYRGMGELGVYPKDAGPDCWHKDRRWWWTVPHGRYPGHYLPYSWNDAIADLLIGAWKGPTRREVEDNAALVFDPSFLPAETE